MVDYWAASGSDRRRQATDHTYSSVIDRRSQGIYNLHTLLLGVEVVALWAALAAASNRVGLYTYYSLLAPWMYWGAIFVGVTGAMRFMEQSHENLLTLGWSGSLQFSARQIAGVAGGIFALAVATKDAGLSRIFVAYYLPLTWTMLTVLDRYQPGWLARIVFAGASGVPTLLMGRPENFPGLERWLEGQHLLGFHAVGVIEYAGAAADFGSLPVVGTFEGLDQALAQSGAKQVMMLELPRSLEDAERLTNVCATRGCRVMIHNNLVVQLERPLRAMAYHGYSFLVLHDEPLENFANRLLKRGLDLVVALPAVLFVLPPLTQLVSLIQKLQSPGRIFYMQSRTGRDGRAFQILKFRTMHESDGEELQQARRTDDRIFPLGRWLRRTSLDEIPQFLNVLRGDMSVVGPRPHLDAHEPIFRRSIAAYRMRFFVKPGITGLAQSRGFRGEASDDREVVQRIRLDLLYIRSWSIWLDLTIIARTIGQVIRPPKSAY